MTEKEIYEALKKADDEMESVINMTQEEIDESLKQDYKRAWLKVGWFKLYLHRMEKIGITEFRFVIKGNRKFMIHPLGKDGETLDFDL